MSNQLRIELDLFVQAVVPIVRERIHHLGVEEAIAVHDNYRVGDQHTADCQAYNAMYRIYGCVDFVRRGGRPDRVCRFRL